MTVEKAAEELRLAIATWKRLCVEADAAKVAHEAASGAAGDSYVAVREAEGALLRVASE